MNVDIAELRVQLRRWRLRFRAWRGSRPFWAGLLTILGGLPIAYFPYADVKLGQLQVRMATTAGAGALIIGVLLITLGLTMWYHKLVRVFAGVASMVLALVSLPISNLGGFGIGFLLAMTGGGMSIAWVEVKTAAGEPAAAPDGETEAEAAVQDRAEEPGGNAISGRTITASGSRLVSDGG